MQDPTTPGSSGSLEIDLPFVVVGPGRRVLKANYIAATWLGYPPEELAGRPLAEVDHAAWGEGVLSFLLDQVDLANAKQEMERTLDLGGMPRTVRLSARPRASGDGYIIEIWDRTELQHVLAIFERFVGTEVLAEILRRAQSDRQDQVGGLLRPTRQDLTVLFADLRGFTAACRDLAPDRVKAMLDDFLTDATDAVRTEGGTVDKFLGDGLMALFGAPAPRTDHPVRGLRAAVRMLRAHRGRRKEWYLGGLPAIPVGLGLEAGEVVYGCLGTGAHLNFTAIGHAVNLASRLCGEAMGGEILMTRPFYARNEQALRKDFDFFGGLIIKAGPTLALKNIQDPVPSVRAFLDSEDPRRPPA